MLESRTRSEEWHYAVCESGYFGGLPTEGMDARVVVGVCITTLDGRDCGSFALITMGSPGDRGS